MRPNLSLDILRERRRILKNTVKLFFGVSNTGNSFYTYGRRGRQLPTKPKILFKREATFFYWKRGLQWDSVQDRNITFYRLLQYFTLKCKNQEWFYIFDLDDNQQLCLHFLLTKSGPLKDWFVVEQKYLNRRTDLIVTETNTTYSNQLLLRQPETQTKKGIYKLQLKAHVFWSLSKVLKRLDILCREQRYLKVKEVCFSLGFVEIYGGSDNMQLVIKQYLDKSQSF